MGCVQRTAVTALAWLAVACTPSPEPARYTVDEYRADAQLRRAQVARCERDPGTLRETPDCINAQTAAAFEDRLRLRDAPPVGLDRAREPDEGDPPQSTESR